MTNCYCEVTATWHEVIRLQGSSLHANVPDGGGGAEHLQGD